MSRRVIHTEKKEVCRGKRRLRLVDPFAILLWSVILAVTLGLAVLSALTGFHEHWYGDVLTLLDWIVGLLALFNLFATLSVGVRVTDGIADVGRNASGERERFDAALLRAIEVVDREGRVQPADARRWQNVSLAFRLTDGTARLSRPASVLTAKQLEKTKRFFGL